MPNWCAGTLRIRGAKENVMKFLDEGFGIYNERSRDKFGNVSYVCKMMDRVNKDLLDDGFDVQVDLHDDGEYIYVHDTRRAFIEWDPMLGVWRNEMAVNYSKDGETMTVILPMKQAWGFEYDDWTEISKKYSIDLHLFGWECGLGFDMEIEIHNGVIAKDEGHDYKDWFWECPNPFIGG